MPNNISQEISQDLTNTFQGMLKSFSSERIVEILLAVILVFIGFLLARFISNTFVKTIGLKLNAHQNLVWRRLIFYAIFLFFVIAGLKEAGFNLSLFLGAAGILTVALGFASQTSASNLISGMFLIGEGAFEVGDTIQITYIRGHTLEGKVISIDLMSVKLLTLDNIYIRLPNEQLIRSPVLNLSKFPIRRLPITLYIDFKEDLSKVRKILLDVGRQYHLALEEPKPTVAVTAFKETSLELLFCVWCRQENFTLVRDEVQEKVCDAFVQHQIRFAVQKIQVLNDADLNADINES